MPPQRVQPKLFQRTEPVASTPSINAQAFPVMAGLTRLQMQAHTCPATRGLQTLQRKGVVQRLPQFSNETEAIYYLEDIDYDDYGARQGDIQALADLAEFRGWTDLAERLQYGQGEWRRRSRGAQQEEALRQDWRALDQSDPANLPRAKALLDRAQALEADNLENEIIAYVRKTEDARDEGDVSSHLPIYEEAQKIALRFPNQVLDYARRIVARAPHHAYDVHAAFLANDVGGGWARSPKMSEALGFLGNEIEKLDPGPEPQKEEKPAAKSKTKRPAKKPISAKEAADKAMAELLAEDAAEKQAKRAAKTSGGKSKGQSKAEKERKQREKRHEKQRAEASAKKEASEKARLAPYKASLAETKVQKQAPAEPLAALHFAFDVTSDAELAGDATYQHLKVWAGTDANLITMLASKRVTEPQAVTELLDIYHTQLSPHITFAEMAAWFSAIDGNVHVDDLNKLFNATGHSQLTVLALLTEAKTAELAGKTLRYLGDTGIAYLVGQAPVEIQAAVRSCDMDREESGHSVRSHGPQVTTVEHDTRLNTGVAPDGRESPTTLSTNFASFQGWEAAAQAATVALPQMAARPEGKNSVVVILAHPGAGSGRRMVGDPAAPANTGALNAVYTKFAISGGQFHMVQHFPSNRAPSPAAWRD